ncbi:uncharacterized protein SCHCODRAFT_02567655 [Schizophyllum commune H4-8]|uniref:F-box domain-containing protein n=1 Tax=Schizophyllum commune (strain H4-8 / FGSC 9210) TaxID=578458 RepID=D8PMK6_SCHCM|nr:uncharacterized protein SCHCODRAFT_02567655 [Schizophyllum commune H4-8]KAI5898795.1 hypothetical protein SCHCODRAFT_02567655 [Schizophyllum commune H4-8]
MQYAGLHDLPPELLEQILTYTPDDDLQHAVYTLKIADSLVSIPEDLMFKHIRLKRPDQATQLYLRLRKDPELGKSARTLYLTSWSIDGIAVINLIRLLPNLVSLILYIGPTSFNPEELEEVFHNELPLLEYLSIRFKPYVQKANYYQFLKGAYFDSALLRLSKWTSGKLPSLSIVQDPMAPDIQRKQKFAQPLVFFRLDPHLSALAKSDYLSTVSSFRLRIPGRQVARSLTSSVHALPSVELLDLSTCNVLEADVGLILTRFTRLRHLILDACAIVRAEMHDSDWFEFGKQCATVGVNRARQREKKLKTWLEEDVARREGVYEKYDIPDQPRKEPGRRARKGRKGLATATISLREKDDGKPSLPAGHVLPKELRGIVPKVRVLPALPPLLSIATSSAIPGRDIPEDKQATFREHFQLGWNEGVAQMEAARTRMRRSSTLGYRILRHNFEELEELEEDEAEVGFNGLEEADASDFTLENRVAPVVCLAGSVPLEKHTPGCGHIVGREVWKDPL